MPAFVCCSYQWICSNENRLLKWIWFTIALSLSRDLHWPIKFQDFCHRTINSRYIYAPKYRTKNWLAFTKKQCGWSYLWTNEGCSKNSFCLTHVKCSRYVSYIIIVILVWSYGYSKCSETNVYVQESMNCSE